MNEQDSKNQIIYQQNCEFYRYQDKLKWSRFQTVIAVEGGMIFAIYRFSLSHCDKMLIMVGGSVIVLLVCILSIIDRIDARSFLRKILEYEDKSKKLPVLTPGFIILIIAIIIVNVFNLILLICKS